MSLVLTRPNAVETSCANIPNISNDIPAGCGERRAAAALLEMLYPERKVGAERCESHEISSVRGERHIMRVAQRRSGARVRRGAC